MREYETMVILDPELDEEGVNEVLEKIKAIISEAGELVSVDDWGVRQLAYPINKKNEGHYLVIQFRAEPQIPKKLYEEYRVNERVMRGIVVKGEE